LQQVFAKIAATRMAGLPILNPALQVQVVGMQPWEGRWVGVLVTPWTISLAMLPGEVPLEHLSLDRKATRTFPSGSYEFMGLDEPELGVCHLCSLISPVHEFQSQEDAVATAEAVIEGLMQSPVDTLDATRQAAEAARLQGQSVARQGITRRDFIRGAFLGG
jgi:[NiFe] hydrogenase assembly HybE family chaperone